MLIRFIWEYSAADDSAHIVLKVAENIRSLGFTHGARFPPPQRLKFPFWRLCSSCRLLAIQKNLGWIVQRHRPKNRRHQCALTRSRRLHISTYTSEPTNRLDACYRSCLKPSSRCGRWQQPPRLPCQHQDNKQEAQSNYTEPILHLGFA